MKSRQPGLQQRQEGALETGIAALGFLAAEPARLARFFELSGMTPAALMAGADKPATLLGVLEHLEGDQSLLLLFCAEASIPADAVAQARLMLGGAGP